MDKKLTYFDVTNGQKQTDPAKLLPHQEGYDSYFIELPHPDQLIDQRCKGLGRFVAALPVDTAPLSLGEGNTPLIASKQHEGLYIKNEGHNPSGNFKDRESAISLAFAHDQGYKRVAIASSGNAAISSARYASLYNIETTCVVPNRTSPQKLDLIRLFGGKIKLVGDTYEESYHYLRTHPEPNTLNITSGMLPIRSEGVKTVAYEIWEELKSVPDSIVCPAGNGSALAAIYHGFRDLQRWGLTDKIPAMICVQIADADPINKAVENDEWVHVVKDIPDSACEAIVAEESFCSPKAVYAIKESKGFGVSLTDDEVVDGLRYAVNKEGILPELSSASVYAAYNKYADEIRALGPITILINTASGLKDLKDITEQLA